MIKLIHSSGKQDEQQQQTPLSPTSPSTTAAAGVATATDHALQLELETSKTRFEELKAATSTKLEEMTRQIETLRASEQQLKQQHDEMNHAKESKVQELNTSIQTMQDQLQQMQHALEQKTQQLETANQHDQEWMEKVKSLEEQLNTTQNDWEAKFTSELDKAQHELKELQLSSTREKEQTISEYTTKMNNLKGTNIIVNDTKLG